MQAENRGIDILFSFYFFPPVKAGMDDSGAFPMHILEISRGFVLIILAAYSYECNQCIKCVFVDIRSTLDGDKKSVHFF